MSSLWFGSEDPQAPAPESEEDAREERKDVQAVEMVDTPAEDGKIALCAIEEKPTAPAVGTSNMTKVLSFVIMMLAVALVACIAD